MRKKPKQREGDAETQGLLLEKLQKLKEADLQNDILSPLFQVLGYDSVDQYGGPDEHGIDLVCWKTDEIDEMELAVAQIKRFKPGRKTYSSTGFAYLITQLSQACETKVPHSNGQAYLPRTIYFVTPHALDARTLSTRFEKVAVLKQRGVKIIDGPKLACLLRKKLPKLVQKILGHTTDIKKAVADRLNNDILLDALNCPSRHSIEDLYMDVDFSLGSRGSRVFLLADLAPRAVDLHLTDADWRSFPYLSSLTERVLGTRVSTEPYEKIEQKYKTELSTYETTRRKLQGIQKKIDPLEEKIRKLRKDLSNLVCKEECKHGDVCKEIAAMVSILEKVLTSPKEVRQFISSIKFSKSKKKVYDTLSKLKKKSNLPTLTIKSLLFRIEDLTRKILPLAVRQLPLKTYKRPLYHLRISATELCKAIRRERRWIMRKLKLFRKKEPSRSELKGFLERSHVLLDCGRRLFGKWYIMDSLQVPRSGECIFDTASYRLEMSVHSIFDCGLNTLVLGNAGAGKTTTLQMYAKAKAHDGEKLCIYISLPTLVSCSSHASTSADSGVKDKLILYVAQYLSSVGCYVGSDELVCLFNSGNLVLELDGIDEVITEVPWLLSAITTFSKTYDATQIIVSSRISFDLADNLPFATVTLLPFSDTQRDAFIRNWFGKDSLTGARNTKRIISHLSKNKEMAEIVCNPLLTTVMCALQEHGVQLPESEVRLHRARMELLLGLYDIHKGAKRLECHPQDLQDVAARVAFVLHSSRIRHTDLSEVIKIAEDYAGNKSRKRYNRAVEELVRPCEVLVPMTDNGRIGLGHLRYQEYLAAKYLSVHRNEDLVPLGHDPWWREVLVLLAKMLPQSEWLVAALAEGNFRPCLDTIKAIIYAHPPKERSRLIEVTLWFKDMEYMDLVLGEATRPIVETRSDTEIAEEDLLRQRGSIRGRIHNM